MKRILGTAAVAGLLLALTTPAAIADKSVADLTEKVSDATEVYNELMATPDRGAPQELLENAKCIAVIPHVLKAAVGYGARHGSGVMTCRTGSGWTAPAFVNISGGSAGLQIGAESTDLVLFFMTEKSAKSIMNGSKLTLGGNVSVAAGPVGRTAEASTNPSLKAEVYSYARSKGLFAGISIEGAKLSTNDEATAKFYGKGMTAKQVLFGKGPNSVPESADQFRAALP